MILSENYWNLSRKNKTQKISVKREYSELKFTKEKKRFRCHHTSDNFEKVLYVFGEYLPILLHQ